MKDITFVDLEVTLNTCRVVDIGAVRSYRTPFHENSFDNLLLFFCIRYLILAGIIY